MIVDLETAKQHMNIIGDADDALIMQKVEAAESHINRLLGFEMATGFEPGDVPFDIKNAVLMLAAHWYENREASVIGVTAQSLPFGVQDVVREYRNWSF
ncbi:MULTISPECIES: head-tail connector protein [unclassified Rhizobium]|uniref:head-tail connector protein n=1 Tax=unclassified Rhizobium TaxID=2613769 RepID=UPI0016106BC7|nr:MULTISPECIES: head-tail connector protein [unclassified Rhizobium]MBB3289905.1 putative phage protein (predicted DNA packaging) [Rhizobium sp. BK252]MBB3404134.1 putative phage protein (predicted DNA packaging) [Rhizobium sp. BK289]MBB3417233.1 putative phage protein (predicted DNA packaging) [Rhizobium sp. BK284]MBB3485110.1 putative phage protein (predicted DNA packaging) [Rhizobium sp. BK347]